MTTSENVTATAAFELTANALLVDDDGVPIPLEVGRIGRLAVRRSIPIGYYKDDSATQLNFVEIGGERYSIPGDLTM